MTGGRRGKENKTTALWFCDYLHTSCHFGAYKECRGRARRCVAVRVDTLLQGKLLGRLGLGPLVFHEGQQQFREDTCQVMESYRGPSSELFNETSSKF